VSGSTSPTISPTSCYIDDTGIHAPTFEAVLGYLQGRLQSIFGSDLYLGNDSQDGQMIAIVASAIADTNSMAIAVYNSFSPSTAQGVGLSTVCKINGLTRLIPTNSVVDLLLVGQAGTIIENGIATDTNNNQWVIPTRVTIPFEGQITVTATCGAPGAVIAAPGTINRIATPTYGWQTVQNVTAAVPGSPLENDVTLRRRQARSTMLPSVSALDGLVGAVASVDGVVQYAVYENDTAIMDSNGVPSHSLAFVIEGGDALQLATVIAEKKTPGSGTYGTTTQLVIDPYGIPHPINFFRPTMVPIAVTVTIIPLVGYTSQIGSGIINRIVDYIASSAIGGDIFLTKVMTVANLTPDTNAFNVYSVVMARVGQGLAAADINLTFNELATCDPTTVTLRVGLS